MPVGSRKTDNTGTIHSSKRHLPVISGKY